MVIALLYLNLKLTFSPEQVRIEDIPPEKLELYFKGQKQLGVNWHYFDMLEQRGKCYFDDEKKLREISGEIKAGKINGLDDKKEHSKYNYINSILKDKEFPIKKENKYEYTNDWQSPRSFGGERTHEGIDIMCKKGTPVVSVSDGRIQKKGWNTLGGWRLGIVDRDNMYYYYAHLDRYAEGLRVGSRVKKGQVIGYVGDTGYGPEGTSGKFEPHLHFGMYELNKNPVSPYPFLQIWE